MHPANLPPFIAIIVGILYPVYAIYGGKKVYQLLSNNPEKKLFVFQQTSIFLIVLLSISTLPILLNVYTLNSIGIGFLKNPWLVLGLFATSLLVLWILSKVTLSKAMAEKVNEANSRVLPFLPATEKEYSQMVVVSFIAGFSEEIVYRGFLFVFLENYISIIPAVLLASLPFAAAHLTSTGIRNSLSAYGLGLIATCLFLVTDSLWLSILLHILVDLYAVTLAYKATQKLTFENNDERSM